MPTGQITDSDDDTIYINASGEGDSDVMDGGTGSDTLQVSTGTHTFSSNGNTYISIFIVFNFYQFIFNFFNCPNNIIRYCS